MKIEFAYFQPLYGAENSFIYFLAIILFLLSVISFLRSNKDFLNPSFIYSICLTGCCSLAALYTNKWNLPMHFNTAVILISMSILFLVGGRIAEYCGLNRVTLLKRQPIVFNGFFIDSLAWLFFVLVLTFSLYLSYSEFISLAHQVTGATEIKNMLGPVINGLTHHDISFSRWHAYRLRFATCIAYISVLAVWLNIMTHQYKEVLKWGCFILLYVPFMILTGGRQQFMYLILYAMISFFLVYRKKSNILHSVGKEFAIIGAAIVIFLLCFLGIGVINGKIGVGTSFINVLVHYAGTNISAFDVYVNEMIVPDSQYIGTTTLDPIYGFLYNHGFDVPQFFQYIPLFTAFGPITTNVYTAFYRYIHDFGYLGCALIMFLLGFFYTLFYEQLYRDGLKNWMILIYASISYPIFLIGREERFFNEILTTSKLSFILGILILYKFFEFFNERRIQKK